MPQKKYYVSQLSQSGMNAPISLELENTVGAMPAWGRSGSGQYFLQHAGFVSAKAHISGFGLWEDTGNPYMPIYTNAGLVGRYTFYVTDGYLNLLVVDEATNEHTDLSNLIGSSKIYLPAVTVYP